MNALHRDQVLHIKQLFHMKSMDTILKGHGMERIEAEVEKINGMSDSVSSFTLSGVGMSRKNVKMKDSQLFGACRNMLLGQITGRHANKFRAEPRVAPHTRHIHIFGQKSHCV